MPTDWRRMWGKMQSNKSNQRKSKCFFFSFYFIKSKVSRYVFSFLFLENSSSMNIYELIKTTLQFLNISYCAYNICIFLFFFLVLYGQKLIKNILIKQFFKASWGFLQMKLIWIMILVVINSWRQLWLQTNLSYKL